MIRRIMALACLTVALLPACCPKQRQCRRPAPVVVRVPVSLPCPRPPHLARPQLPLADLAVDATPREVVRAYTLSLELLAGHGRELEAILDGYSKPKETEQP